MTTLNNECPVCLVNTLDTSEEVFAGMCKDCHDIVYADATLNVEAYAENDFDEVANYISELGDDL